MRVLLQSIRIMGVVALSVTTGLAFDGGMISQVDSSPGVAAMGSWFDRARVGYDDGFVIASRSESELQADRDPFRLKINGWGQLRHTASNLEPPNTNLNQFQLKRGRLIFSGCAFNPNVQFFVQLDGRSSSGDAVRLLDYYLSYDFGNDQLGLEPGLLGLRTGMFKMPFSLARWISGKEFEFTDRSMASMFFDVNRSFAVGLYGVRDRAWIPTNWEIAIFNGLVTGGAETGASGMLDDNFAYSGRLMMYPIGEWGDSSLADLEYHRRLAMRVGMACASSKVSRDGETEFNVVRVVDSGQQLASLLPLSVSGYQVTLFSADTSFKFRGWSTTVETYFRRLDKFEGNPVPNLSEFGFWLQAGYMVIPNKLELLARWSRIVGDSGTLGAAVQSSDEIAGGFAWYFRENRSKLVIDLTHLNGASVDSASLDINPGDNGWLFRSQIQFSF